MIEVNLIKRKPSTAPEIISHKEYTEAVELSKELVDIIPNRSINFIKQVLPKLQENVYIEYGAFESEEEMTEYYRRLDNPNEVDETGEPVVYEPIIPTIERRLHPNMIVLLQPTAEEQEKGITAKMKQERAIRVVLAFEEAVKAVEDIDESYFNFSGIFGG